MTKDDVELPDWMIEKLRDQYVAELKKIAEDDDAEIYISWMNGGFEATFTGESEGVFFSRTSKPISMVRFIEDFREMRTEPYNFSKRRIDSEHYERLGRIADDLEEAARRARYLHSHMEVIG